MTAFNVKLGYKCLKIIKSNDMEDAVNKIANLKREDNKKIGRKLAIEIYQKYGYTSVQYNMKEHSHNIDKYYDKVNSNIKNSHNLK
jgi:ERCC4-type nuclease